MALFFCVLAPKYRSCSQLRRDSRQRWFSIPVLRAQRRRAKLSVETPPISDFRSAVGNPVHNDAFPVTRHSVVLAMRSDDPRQRLRAAETIAAAYWKPIYKYVRLKWNLEREDAQDFTQEFLLRMIAK